MNKAIMLFKWFIVPTIDVIFNLSLKIMHTLKIHILSFNFNQPSSDMAKLNKA